MPTIHFTRALKRFFPNLEVIESNAKTVEELIPVMEEKYPGLKSYIIDNSGALREHVNIYIGENLIKDRAKLADVLQEKDEVYVMQALSGG